MAPRAHGHQSAKADFAIFQRRIMPVADLIRQRENLIWHRAVRPLECWVARRKGE
jgi:hypothetical protein